MALLTLAAMAVIIFDSSIFTSETTASYLGRRSQTLGVLDGDEPFVQPFVPEKEDIAFIEARLATYTDETAKGYITFQVQNPSGKVLYSENVDIKDLVNGEYHRFNVNLELDTTQKYRYTLQAFEYGFEKAPMVWVSSNVQDALRNVSYPGLEEGVRYQSNAQFGYVETNTFCMYVSVILVALSAFVAIIDVNVREKTREKLCFGVLFTMPIAMYFMVEILNGNSALLKTLPIYFISYIFYLLVYLISFAVFNRFRLSMILANTVFFAVAVFNHFKLLWRGEPIQLLDIVTLKTAVNVSGSYHPELSPILVIAALGFILATLTIWKCNYRIPRIRTRIIVGALSVSLSAFLVMALFDTDRYQVTAFSVMQKLGIVNNVWNQPSNFTNNGMLIALTMNAQYLNVEKPENYGEGSLRDIQAHVESGTGYEMLDEEVMNAYEEEKANRTTPLSTSEEALAAGQKPNIICIMNESYTDLSSIGDFETNLPLSPFMDSMEENTLRGDVHVSTYGGGTANSEFEFLTGNSMTFFPNGSIPYQQYIDSTSGSLARILKAEGYSAIAVHPYLASGWNRPDVYEHLGFDQFLSIDDFGDNAEFIRSYISDRCSYKKLIELYENKQEGQPLFLFNVTMQNHGSYTSTNPNFNQDVELTEYPGRFLETEQYLSLARQSDIAVEELINYFENADEPTIICFFGDHLPSMKNGFYETVMGKELVELSAEEMENLYMTDFFIWANYDIPEAEIEDISLNYLSTLLLQTAGIDLPDYNILISECYQQYPILSTMAIYDAEGNRYSSVLQTGDPTGILEYYNMLTYNNVFETTGRVSGFFDKVNFTPTQYVYGVKREEEGEPIGT